MFFAVLMALFVIFLKFVWWNLPKFIQLNKNFKQEESRICKGSFLFLQIFVFYCCEKNWTLISVKYLLPVS